MICFYFAVYHFFIFCRFDKGFCSVFVISLKPKPRQPWWVNQAYFIKLWNGLPRATEDIMYCICFPGRVTSKKNYIMLHHVKCPFKMHVKITLQVYFQVLPCSYTQHKTRFLKHLFSRKSPLCFTSQPVSSCRAAVEGYTRGGLRTLWRIPP